MRFPKFVLKQLLSAPGSVVSLPSPLILWQIEACRGVLLVDTKRTATKIFVFQIGFMDDGKIKIFFTKTEIEF